ncbi:hypothetical protein LSCM1_01834 [Leishmania martiniquensis]|uniref:Cation efflux protein transmembrane domain-containing protein n=1 Tax=Leishmania martiniquensis TaxID=1580590 RepID=A0A836GEC9_9TRYP|nr:hypothetical protein LSCM1_01834 [Leishmania martiniquensis]
MLQEARALLFAPSRSKEHRRWRQAAITFAVLWAISILFIMGTSFLIASVQALVLLNIAASLTAAVVTQSLSTRGGTQQNYPFSFGMYRLSVVVRLGSTIFLVFGCATAVAECLHSGIHVHHSNPSPLFAIGLAQLLSQIVFRRHVRLADRVTGHRGMAGAQSEDIIYLLSDAGRRDGRTAREGSLLDELREPPSGPLPSQSLGRPAVPHGTPGDAYRAVHSNSTAIFLYLLCPITCVLSSVLMVLTKSAAPDMIGALFLAAYYAYVGCHNGRDMAELLMNKCVTEPRRLRSLGRCLRSITALEGVLLVESTVWWDVNVSESMLLIRLRLASGSDACAVSRAARKQLTELATYVYVECFPALGSNDFRDGDHLSWGVSLMSAHGHSHGSHGNCQGDHRHQRENGGFNDHRHSHGRGCDEKDHHSHAHQHSHGDVSAPSGGAISSARRQADQLAYVKSGTPPGYVEADLPSSAHRFAGSASYMVPTGAAPGSQAFPTPPAHISAGYDPSAGWQRFSIAPLPAGNGSSGEELCIASRVANNATTAAAASSPLTNFPNAALSLYGAGAMVSDNRFHHSATRDAGGRAVDATSFPAASSPRLPAMPPPVFTPFRDPAVPFGNELRRGAPHGTTHEPV